VTAPRVVFLPGVGGDPAFWKPVADRLGAAIDPVRLGWPGLGPVPARDDVRGFDDLLRLTLETMDRPVDLVAQSMGGVIAVRAALARPDRVRRLVLTATSGGIDVRALGAADWRPDYRRDFPSSPSWVFEPVADLTDRIRSIVTPTLLLWGDADPISPVAVGRRLAALLPRAELFVIPGGDPAFARDRADEVAPHVSRHLGDRGAG
jgi:pimeloyl-ACP methyl ester carboxylesterase